MGIKKSRDSTFTVVKSGFQVSKDGIRRAGKYADPMGQGKEEEEQGQDPVQFLPKKLQKKWRSCRKLKNNFTKNRPSVPSAGKPERRAGNQRGTVRRIRQGRRYRKRPGSL